jgi:hypothetical protein
VGFSRSLVVIIYKLGTISLPKLRYLLLCKESDDRSLRGRGVN